MRKERRIPAGLPARLADFLLEIHTFSRPDIDDSKNTGSIMINPKIDQIGIAKDSPKHQTQSNPAIIRKSGKTTCMGMACT